MRVVLTGGSGFLGRPCLELLLQGGHEVLAISRGIPGEPAPGGLHWHSADLNLPSSYAAALEEFQPQAALHLAWEGIPDYSLANSLRNLQTGSMFTEALLKVGCKHVVASGSCWEYGKLSGALSENMEPAAPGVFGASKTAQRILLRSLTQAAGATLAWARVFYPFGPRQKAKSLVPTICQSILSGHSPDIKTPWAANDFLYLDDTADALVFLIEKGADGVFNVGSGATTAVGKIADMLLQLAGREPHFSTLGESTSGTSGFFADIAAMNAIGWRVKTSLEEGLRRTFVEYTERPTTC